MPRRPDMPCASCGSLMWRGKGVLPEGQARCRECRKAQAPEHGTYSRYRRGCRCDDCREANRAYCSDWQAKYREKVGRGYYDGYDRPGKPRLDAKCLGCGEVVIGAYRKDRPYHAACRERTERVERRRRLAAERLAKAASGTTGWGIWTSGPCQWCGESFTTRANVPAGFCSRTCRVAERTRRYGKFKVRPADRLAIYERDDWVCQLCMEPVDPALMETDPLSNWAPSLDHIEPQSTALIPDHSPRNLRLAHRWCNSVRGDLSYYTDADLRVA